MAEQRKKFHQTSVRFPEEDHQALTWAAVVNGRDIAEEIRGAISGHLAFLRSDPDFLKRERTTAEQMSRLFRKPSKEPSS